MSRSTASGWWKDFDDWYEFAHVLYVCEMLTTTEDTLLYMEKPWKWDDEHEAWVRWGKPNEVTNPALEKFIKEVS